MVTDRTTAIVVTLTPAEAQVVVPALRLYQEVLGHGHARLDASQESYSDALGHVIDAMIKVEDAQRSARNNGSGFLTPEQRDATIEALGFTPDTNGN